jgi:hypothetical protein
VDLGIKFRHAAYLDVREPAVAAHACCSQPRAHAQDMGPAAAAPTHRMRVELLPRGALSEATQKLGVLSMLRFSTESDVIAALRPHGARSSVRDCGLHGCLRRMLRPLRRARARGGAWQCRTRILCVWQGRNEPAVRRAGAEGAAVVGRLPRRCWLRSLTRRWQALTSNWCCAKSGAIAFDLPPAFAASALAADGGCAPQQPASYPGVLAAAAAQDACMADAACWSNCRNRLSKNGRVACRDLNITL